jgi:hypothetical protein
VSSQTKTKKFLLLPEQIRPLAEGHGACFATDHITVGGLPVGFMYREEPDSDSDSGWRFFSGKETQEYTEDPSHVDLHDVNTIANYDPSIVPLLDSAYGSAFERGANGQFVAVELESDSEPEPAPTIH